MVTQCIPTVAFTHTLLCAALEKAREAFDQRSNAQRVGINEQSKSVRRVTISGAMTQRARTHRMATHSAAKRSECVNGSVHFA